MVWIPCSIPCKKTTSPYPKRQQGPNRVAPVNIAVLQIDFLLRGCRSLKEKRQRLKGIRDKYGRAANVAVCESDHQDVHERAQWSFVAVASNAAVVESTLMEIERSLQLGVDAELVGAQREWL
jgi:uncharacterized protein YlxP (DUF503 family)